MATYVLSWVKYGAALTDKNVARNDILVYQRLCTMSVITIDTEDMQSGTHQRTSLLRAAFRGSRRGWRRFHPHALWPCGQTPNLHRVGIGWRTEI